MDNIGRNFPNKWDKRLPLGLYVLCDGRMRPYTDISHSKKVEMVWKKEGISVAFDDPASYDFSKGYMIALPGSPQSWRDRSHCGPDLRTDKEISWSYGKYLLRFEQEASSLPKLFKAYARMYDKDEDAKSRVLNSEYVPVDELITNKEYLEVAKKQYNDTLYSVIKYADHVLDNNSEVYTPVTMWNGRDNPRDFLVLDERTHEEMARTLTFGSDEEINELLRCVEVAALWRNGKTVLDTTRGACLIAEMWPDRRDQMADLICEVVQRDCLRVNNVILGSVSSITNENYKDKWKEFPQFYNDIKEWANDVTVALACAWLMTPEKMPDPSFDAALTPAYGYAENIVKYLQENPVLNIRSDEKPENNEQLGAVIDASLNICKYLMGVLDDDFSGAKRDIRHLSVINNRQRREIAGAVPQGRLNLLADVIATGDAMGIRYNSDGNLVYLNQLLTWHGDLEGSIEAASVLISEKDMSEYRKSTEEYIERVFGRDAIYSSTDSFSNDKTSETIYE